MCWVVIYAAEPNSKWDCLSQSFATFERAFAYAAELAEGFYKDATAPNVITILSPDGEANDWKVESFEFLRLMEVI